MGAGRDNGRRRGDRAGANCATARERAPSVGTLTRRHDHDRRRRSRRALLRCCRRVVGVSLGEWAIATTLTAAATFRAGWQEKEEERDCCRQGHGVLITIVLPAASFRNQRRSLEYHAGTRRGAGWQGANMRSAVFISCRRPWERNRGLYTDRPSEKAIISRALDDRPQRSASRRLALHQSFTVSTTRLTSTLTPLETTKKLRH